MTIHHIGDLRARAEQAQRDFEAGRARLYRADGVTPIYSDDEHTEQLNALRVTRNKVLDEVAEQLRAAFQEANAEITFRENLDPSELLSPEELERANARRAFALDQAETLDTTALVARFEAVLAGGDRAAIFAFWMAGMRRRQQILERRRESARRAEGTVATGAAAAARTSSVTPLDEALERMHEALDKGRTAAAVESARERLAQIDSVRQSVYLARSERTSLYEPDLAISGPGGAR